MKISVVGVGYVGLVTAACLAEAGNSVICVDKDKDKIEGLENGVIPIYEPGLAEMVRHNEQFGRLHFTTELKHALDNSLIVFLAVGTPSAADGSSDISAILEVAGQIAEHLSEYRIIVTKSTVPVGTHKIVSDLIRSRTAVPFDYVSNPEFLKEGAAVNDFLSPDRIIIGTDNAEARRILSQLYAPFMRKSRRLLFMDPASAEMTKYAANTMLATRISFINEIAELCEKLGADVELVRQGLGSDSRIGSAFLFPGVGFGGSCFPKDIRAIIHMGEQAGVDMKIAKAAQQVNTAARRRFAGRIIQHFGGGAATLAVWGLAFKANTDDVRESPAIFCIEQLLEAGMRIKAYDPVAADEALKVLGPKIEIATNAYEALEGAEALVIFTDWQEFRNPDLEAVAAKLKKPVVFDGRNLLDGELAAKAGIEYYSIGR